MTKSNKQPAQFTVGDSVKLNRTGTPCGKIIEIYGTIPPACYYVACTDNIVRYVNDEELERVAASKTARIRIHFTLTDGVDSQAAAWSIGKTVNIGAQAFTKEEAEGLFIGLGEWLGYEVS